MLDLRTKTASWSSNGCKKIKSYRENKQKFITCSCDHLTNFAIIFMSENDFKMHNESKALELISNFGIGMSIGALIITLVTYLGFK